MSGSNRLHNIALGGCLAALLLIAPALAQENKPVGSDTKENAGTDQRIAPSPDRSDRFFWEYHQGKPESYRAVCEKPQSRADADLCQQWRMAQAAREQADLTFLLLVVTAVEIAALLVILGFTIYSTKLSRDANRIARESSERQLRAYVDVFTGTVQWKNGNIVSAAITMKNAGQTPAHKVQQWMRSGVRDHLNFKPLPTPKEGRSVYNLGAGGTMTHNVDTLPYDDETWKCVRDRSLPFYVWGELLYKDAFGRVQKTKLRMVLNPHKDVLSPCEEGNDST